MGETKTLYLMTMTTNMDMIMTMITIIMDTVMTMIMAINMDTVMTTFTAVLTNIREKHQEGMHIPLCLDLPYVQVERLISMRSV